MATPKQETPDIDFEADIQPDKSSNATEDSSLPQLSFTVEFSATAEQLYKALTDEGMLGKIHKNKVLSHARKDGHFGFYVAKPTEDIDFESLDIQCREGH